MVINFAWRKDAKTIERLMISDEKKKLYKKENEEAKKQILELQFQFL